MKIYTYNATYGPMHYRRGLNAQRLLNGIRGVSVTIQQDRQHTHIAISAQSQIKLAEAKCALSMYLGKNYE